MELFNGEIAKEKVLLVLDDATLSHGESLKYCSLELWGIGSNQTGKKSTAADLSIIQWYGKWSAECQLEMR